MELGIDSQPSDWKAELALNLGRNVNYRRLVIVLFVLAPIPWVAGCSGDSGPSQAEIQAQEAAQQAAADAAVAQAEVEALREQLDEQAKAAESTLDSPQETTNGGGGGPGASPSEPPKVVGLTLPAAKRLLKEAGFRANPRNTDTTFGILIPENFTVCKQDPPRGDLVPLLAQKYGC
jgi:hypothetical protein